MIFFNNNNEKVMWPFNGTILAVAINIWNWFISWYVNSLSWNYSPRKFTCIYKHINTFIVITFVVAKKKHYQSVGWLNKLWLLAPWNPAPLLKNGSVAWSKRKCKRHGVECLQPDAIGVQMHVFLGVQQAIHQVTGVVSPEKNREQYALCVHPFTQSMSTEGLS